MTANEAFYKHLKELEEQSKRETEMLFYYWSIEPQLKKIAKEAAEEAAKRYLDAHERDIEINLDKRSLNAVQDALRNLF